MKNIYLIVLVSMLSLITSVTYAQTWTKFFSYEGLTCPASAIATNDGGVVVMGENIIPISGITDSIFLVKFDADGMIEWNRRYGSGNVDSYFAYAVESTSSGGYFIGGRSVKYGIGSGPFYLRTDSEGIEEFHVAEIDTISIGVHNMIKVADEGYVLLGSRYNNPEDSIFLLKVDEAGTEQWIKTIGTEEWTPNTLIQTADGGFFVAGDILVDFDTGDNDYYWLKTDANGTIEWGGAFGLATECEFISEVIQTADGGFILCGYVVPGDPHLIKLSATGEQEWDINFDGYFRIESEICHAIDGNYIVAGEGPQMAFMKINVAGEVIWHTFHEVSLGADSGYSVADLVATSDGHYVAVYEISGGLGTYVVKFDDNGNVTNTVQYSPDFQIAVYPNPATEKITFERKDSFPKNTTLEIFNIKGQSVLKQAFDTASFEWTINQQPTGIYSFIIRNDANIIHTGKLMIE